MKTRLEEHYHAAVRPALMEKFGYKNTLEVPKIEKIIINMGVGEAVRDSKKIEHATRDLATRGELIRLVGRLVERVAVRSVIIPVPRPILIVDERRMPHAHPTTKLRQLWPLLAAVRWPRRGLVDDRRSDLRARLVALCSVTRDA